MVEWLIEILEIEILEWLIETNPSFSKTYL